MKRAPFILLLFVLGIAAVVQAQGGGVMVTQYDPQIHIYYEQLPAGWTVPEYSLLFWKDKTPYADSDESEDSDLNVVRTTDDNGRTIEITYAYRHRGTIELRAPLSDNITNLETLRRYVQERGEFDYAAVAEREIILDGAAGYELSFTSFYPTRVEPDCNYSPLECSLYSAEAYVYRYILIMVDDTAPLLIEIRLQADAYHEAYPVDDAVRGSAADWTARLGGDWDHQVRGEIDALTAEADYIVNGLQFTLGGETLPTTEPTSANQTETSGLWQFSYRQVTDPTTPGYVLAPDKYEDACQWGFAVEVGENTAVSGFQYNTAQSAGCAISDGGPGSATTTHTWTVPPNQLLPGDNFAYAIAVAAAAFTGAPPADRLTAWTSLWQEISSQECAFDDCLLGEAYYYELDDTYGTLPSGVENQWLIPGGTPGDRLTLTVNVLGAGHHALIDYVYEFQTVTINQDDNISQPPLPTDPSIFDDTITPDDIWNMLPAGFGGLGDMPGPNSLAQALAGVVAPAVLIAILSGLGELGGSEFGGEDDPPDAGGPPGPQEMTVTDQLGRDFTYVWNPDYGGYINPETGGMFDPGLWTEYNQNLAGNQEFVARQRENVAKITPLTPQQEFDKALAMAHKMIARIPYKHGDPLQKQLDAISHGVQSQGTITAVQGIARTAWDHYQGRQSTIRQEQMDLDRQLGYVQTGLQVTATAGKIAGSVAEGMLGGSGFVTGFVYGAAENWDKGAGGMVANGLIGGTFGWAGNRLGNVSPDGILWNAATGGLSGAAESAVSDYYNTGEVDVAKMKWSAGRAMIAPDVIPPDTAIPLSQQPPGVRKMFGNVAFGPDGKPYAQLEDVIALQSSSTDMRSLKNAPPEVREAFNNTLRKKVYDPHDQALLDWIGKHVPDANGRPLKVDDFRTPGAGGPDPRAINTDRDYRVLAQNDRGEWIEVRKELWQDKSYELFGQQTGFDGTAVKQARPEVDWDRLTPEQQIAKQHELWADQHQQLATDRASIEASPDYSDQAGLSGQWAQVESNILKVKHGEATLQDADAIGQMYYEKVAASLRRDNTPEAVAQAQKAVKSLWDVRRGYAMQNLPAGHLPDNLNQAMHIIKNAPVDHRATPEAMAAMNQQLAHLGFPDGVNQVTQGMSAQFSALKMAGGKP